MQDRSHIPTSAPLRSDPGVLGASPSLRFGRCASWLVIAAASLLLGGCALGYLHPGYSLPSERRERLGEAAGRYAGFLRFGNLEKALSFVEPEQRAEFLSMFAGDESLRITDAEVASVEFGETIGSATVLLQARLYRLPSVREILITETQRWRFEPKSLRWFVSPDFSAYQARASSGAGARTP